MSELAALVQHYWPNGVSMMSVILLCAVPMRPLRSPILYGWIFLSGLVLILSTLGFLQVDLLSLGYVHNGIWGLLCPALWVGVTVYLVVSESPCMGIVALLPALFWRLGLSPSPEFFCNYLDAPLFLLAFYQTVRHVSRRVVRPSWNRSAGDFQPSPPR